MCAYQEPEVYVKRFVGVLYPVLRVFNSFFEEVRVPHIRLKGDYGVENIVIEAKSPYRHVTDREKVKKYMKSYTLALLA